MKPLILRKQLLIAESELNRAQLVQDGRRMTADAAALTRRAGDINAFTTAVLSLVTVILSSRSATAAPENNSWWRMLVKGAQPLAALWAVFRDRPR